MIPPTTGFQAGDDAPAQAVSWTCSFASRTSKPHHETHEFARRKEGHASLRPTKLLSDHIGRATEGPTLVRYFAPTLTRLGGVDGLPSRVCRPYRLRCRVARVQSEELRLAVGRRRRDVAHDAVHPTSRTSDTQAIHAKLDELLRVEGRARSELTQLDDEEPETIARHRLGERRPQY